MAFFASLMVNGSAKSSEACSVSAAATRPDLFLRFQHDFYAVVPLVLEDLIPFRRVLKPQAVRDDEAGIDLPVPDLLEQRTDGLTPLSLRFSCSEAKSGKR
jgi:hypothetical protein